MGRIFFDSNVVGEKYGYLLWFSRSIEDIQAMNNYPAEGDRVLMYMPESDGEEITVEALLVFDNDFNCWKGIPVRN